MSTVDLIANAASGGVLGLVGSGLSKIFNVVNNVQKFKSKQAEYEHELALLDKEAELKGIEQENELLIKTSADAAKIRSDSYGVNFFAEGGSTQVTDLLRLVRPTLTVSLILLTGIIWCFSDDKTIQSQIVDTVLFCTASSLTWWFGDRADYLKRKK